MAWKGVITNAGSALLARRGERSVLTVSRAAAGAGRVSDVLLMSQTALADERQTMSIVSRTATAEGHKIECVIGPPEAGYRMTQYGLWAKLDGGAETLLAIFQNDQDVAIPSKADSPDFSVTIWSLLTFSNVGSLEITVDASAAVSYADLMAMIESGYIGTAKAEITVPAEAWAADEAPEIAGYPCHADVAFDNLSGDEVPTVTFHDPGKARAVAPVAKTVAKALRLYAVSAPGEELSATVTFSAGTSYSGSGEEPPSQDLKPATKSRLGGVMPGDDFTVDAQGHLSINTERVLTRDAVAPADEVIAEIAPLLGGEK